MAILIESKTADGAKNRWATAHNCFADAQALYGRKFSLDVCAEPQTARVDRFYVSPEWLNSQPSLDIIRKHSDKKIVGFDALQCDWDRDWWCNPPFDLKQEFLEKAYEQAIKGRGGWHCYHMNHLQSGGVNTLQIALQPFLNLMAVTSSMKSTE